MVFPQTFASSPDLVKSLEAPGGIGEPVTSCVMPALTDAIVRDRQAHQEATRR